MFFPCRVSTIKKFPPGTMDTLRILINQEEVYFLMLSRTEQELLVDKMLQRMVSGAALGCHGDVLLGRKGGEKKLNQCIGAHRCLCAVL